MGQGQRLETRVGQQVEQHQHFFWGLLCLAVGVVIGYVWLWGNIIQIQTSEAWIMGSTTGFSLAPNFQIYLQLGKLGSTSLQDSIAIIWGWINQIILLVFSIGIELHLVGKTRQRIWQWGCWFFIILNSLADLSYGGAFGGGWQPWAFAGICFMASFFFGLAAFHLIIQGLKYLF